MKTLIMDLTKNSESGKGKKKMCMRELKFLSSIVNNL